MRALCRAGGGAAFLLLAYSLATMAQLAVLGGAPANAEEAFRLLRVNRVAGLLRLDLPTALAMPLYVVLFGGVYAALRAEARRAARVTAGAGALAVAAGVALMLAAPSALSMAALSDRHAAAASEAERAQLLRAGDALMARDLWHGRGPWVGALLIQGAALAVSIAMRRSATFGQATAWVGIVTHTLDLAHVVAAARWPAPAAALMMAAGPLYLAWFPMVGRGLLRAGRLR
jgi:hypothetical protein